VPVMLQRPDVWEVPISCAYAMAMLALAGIWRALHDPARRCWWLAAASLAYGLAVGARPTVLSGAVILLVPVAHAWGVVSKQGEQRWPGVVRLLTAAMAPISFIGFGLMLYNYLRFDNPLEFGQHYQIAAATESVLQHMFGLKYLWFNFRVYFLQPVHWDNFFPFVDGIKVPPAPAGQVGVDGGTFGVLSNNPFVWMALAIPLTWQNRTTGERSILRLFLMALAIFFGTSSLTICLYAGACARYQVDFVPAMMILAGWGVFSLEGALAAKPQWRSVVRCCWITALFFSVTVSLLMSVQRYAEEQFRDGLGRLHFGRPKEAAVYFEEALRINPNYTMAHYYFAITLVQAGRLSEAISQYGQVLRLDPSYPGAREGLLQTRQKLKQQTVGPPN
jgi:tetratricopeptide (TPR) repeat protein